jgi:hypothetical protein
MQATSTIANEQRVRETAYLIWEQAGRPFGQAELHWEMAKELNQRIDAAAEIAPAPIPRPVKKRALARPAGAAGRGARGRGENSIYQ